MKRVLIKFFILTILILSFFVVFLNFYGIETKRFNNLVESEIKNFNSNINVSLNKIKIKFDLRSLNLYFETIKPQIIFLDSSIPVEKIKVYLNLKKLIKNQKNINEVQINISEVDHKSLDGLIKIIKPSNFKSILLENLKEGSIKSNLNLKFDDDLKITSYIIDGYVRNFKLQYNNFDINKSSFIYTLRNNSGEISNFSGKINNLAFNNAKIEYLNENEITLNIKSDINGVINNKNISNFLINSQKFYLSDLDFNYTTNSSHYLNIKLNKNFEIKSYNYDIKRSSDILKLKLKTPIKSNFLEKKIKNFEIKDINLKSAISDENNNILSLKGKFNLNDSEYQNISIESKFTKKSKKFLIKLSSKENVLMPILNYKNNNSKFNVILDLETSKKFYELQKFSFEEGKNKVEVDNLKLDKNFKIISLKNMNVETFNNEKANNKFKVSIGKKININGKKYDATNLLNLLDDSNEKQNLLEGLSKEVKISFDNLQNPYNPVNKFNLIGKITDGSFTKISSKGEFEDGKYLDITLKKDQNSNKKIFEIYSDYPKPLLSNYKFFNDLQGGKLLINSTFDDTFSEIKIKIEKFKIINAPAFVKLLSLADLGGMADLVSGEGLSFDDMEIQIEKNKNSLKIKELYAIGSSISILMEGFRDNSTNIISLRGTMIPAKNINKFLSKIPVVGEIIIPKEVGEGLFGVSFKIKGKPGNLKTTVNPVRTLTPRFIQKALEKKN